MKNILYIFLFLTLGLKAQTHPAVKLLNGDVNEYKPNNHFKLSFQSQVNTDPLSALNTQGGYQAVVHDLGGDYLSVVKYDLRIKIYLTQWLRVMGGVQAVGINTDKYTYKLGLTLKF